jgi:hypothetical protein
MGKVDPAATIVRRLPMPSEEVQLDIPPRLHIRYILPDGRCSTLIVWPDGDWKVEVFASKDHILKFVEQYPTMEIIDHGDTSPERE